MQFIKYLLLISLLVLMAGCKTVSETETYQKYTDQQIFDSAQSDMQKKHYEKAVKEFEALDALYPFGVYSEKGQLNIIQAYYYNEDKESALAAADRYIRLYPRSGNVDEAYYWKGVINQGETPNWFLGSIRAHHSSVDVSSQSEAYQDFSTLINQFPDSRYTPEARKRLAELQAVVAQHDLNIAEYYMHRETYVAAINRATEVVQNFPNTTQATAAYALMAKAYQALNEPELSQLARQHATK